MQHSIEYSVVRTIIHAFYSYLQINRMNVPKTVQCKVCSREYHSLERLLEHMETHVTAPVAAPMATVMVTKLKTKQKGTLTGRCHACTQCGFTTTGRNKLKSHYFATHDAILTGTREQPIILPKKYPKKRPEAQTKQEMTATTNSITIPAAAGCAPSTMPVLFLYPSPHRLFQEEESAAARSEGADTPQVVTTPTVEESATASASCSNAPSTSDAASAPPPPPAPNAVAEIPLSLRLDLTAVLGSSGQLHFNVVNFVLQHTNTSTMTPQSTPVLGQMNLPRQTEGVQWISPRQASAVQRRRNSLN